MLSSLHAGAAGRLSAQARTDSIGAATAGVRLRQCAPDNSDLRLQLYFGLGQVAGRMRSLFGSSRRIARARAYARRLFGVQFRIRQSERCHRQSRAAENPGCAVRIFSFSVPCHHAPRDRCSTLRHLCLALPSSHPPSLLLCLSLSLARSRTRSLSRALSFLFSRSLCCSVSVMLRPFFSSVLWSRLHQP